MIDKSSITKTAQMYAAKGQIDKAIAEWEKLLSVNPDGNTYNLVGDLYLRKRSRSEAIGAFSKAAKMFRDDGFYLKAIALYKKILNISPLEADALISLGELNAEKGLVGNACDNFSAAADIYLKDGLTENALEIYDKALKLTPSDIPLKIKIIELYLKIGLKEEASKQYLSIASDFLEKADKEKASEFYIKALQHDPKNIPAYIGMSRLAEEAGDIQLAYEQLGEALSFAPDDHHVLFHFARLAIAAGNLQRAKESLVKLTELEPANTHYKKQLGLLYLKEGSVEKAWMEFFPYIDETIQQEQWSESLSLLEQFKKIDPIEVGRRLVTVYKGMNDTGAAAAELKALADTYEKNNSMDEALSVLREAGELNPDDRDVLERIQGLEVTEGEEEHVSEDAPKEELSHETLAEADRYIRKGMLPEAAGLLSRLVAQDPENLAFHTRLKDVYLESDQKDKAADEYLVIAELHGKSGDIEAKKAIIAEALNFCPDDSRIISMGKGADMGISISDKTETVSGEVDESFDEKLIEADFYAQQGLKDEALKLYKELLANHPHHRDISKKIEALGASVGAGGEPVMEPEALDSDLTDIFHEFKKGIDKELGDKDGESRYNLGIAYKEMGLLDDAIKEFQIAAKDPSKTLHSSNMLALCYMDKNLYHLAIEEFKKVLSFLSQKDAGYLEVKCDLADAYVKNREFSTALTIYNEIYALNPGFRDVERKVQIIKSKLTEEKGKPKTKKDRVSYI